MVGHGCLPLLSLLSFAALTLAGGSDSASSSIAATTLAPPTHSSSDCPYRTINYITHTLPAQCLRSNWSRAGLTPESPGAEHSPEATASTTTITAATGPEGETREPSDVAVAPSGIKDARGQESSVSSGAGSSSETDMSATASSVTASSTETKAAAAATDAEADSPLDKAKFLSFEEWKKQNLARAGQSPETVGRAREGQDQDGKARRRPGIISNALDSLGDDAEIEWNFRGLDVASEAGEKRLGMASTGADGSASSLSRNVEGAASETAAASSRPRSKDAGKTCKERFNYASFDCAATVLKSNPESKSSSSVLVENKDSYLLNECSATNKFLIVELCNDILVDTVVLANFEFFSSMFRTFRVSVSDRYPVKLDRWRELGTFEATNSRDIQAFLIENPLIWARYLRVEFLTHYGNEYYCPVSLLRVHGTTMMEEFRHQEYLARGEDVDDEVAEDVPGSSPVATAGEAVSSSQHTDVKGESTAASTVSSSDVYQESSSSVSSSTGERSNKDQASGTATQPVESGPSQTSAGSHDELDEQPTANATGKSPLAKIMDIGSYLNASLLFQPARRSGLAGAGGQGIDGEAKVTDRELRESRFGSDARGAELGATNGTESTGSGVSSSSQDSQAPTKTVADHNSSESAAQETSRTPSSTSQSPSPPPANPTTQESFFKSLHKRVQVLESNSTLSLQYIEEQSRILRDAFMQVERRQMAKTDAFLEYLSKNVSTELKDFRLQYDQLWQSTVIELETQRERYQREILAISSRLTLLADEVVLQKRMSIVQSTLLLLCLGLVLFGRSGSHTLELPLLQQMMEKSQSALRLRFESRSASPSPGRMGLSPLGRKHVGSPRERGSDLLDGSMDDASNPELGYSPTTPTSETLLDDRSSPYTPLNGSPETEAQASRHSFLADTQSDPPTPGGNGSSAVHGARPEGDSINLRQTLSGQRLTGDSGREDEAAVCANAALPDAAPDEGRKDGPLTSAEDE